MKKPLLIPLALAIFGATGLVLHWMDQSAVPIRGTIVTPAPPPPPPSWFQHHQERQARIEELAASRSAHR